MFYVKKKYFLIAICCCLANFVFSQHDSVRMKKNTFFLEALGNGAGILSLNYDRLIPLNSFYAISLRGGIAYVNSGYLSFPALINVITGKGNNHFELGIGETFENNVYVKKGNYQITTTLDLGYRFQKPDGGIFFKCAYTPIFYNSQDSFSKIFWLYIGLGIGYTF